MFAWLLIAFGPIGNESRNTISKLGQFPHEEHIVLLKEICELSIYDRWVTYSPDRAIYSIHFHFHCLIQISSFGVEIMVERIDKCLLFSIAWPLLTAELAQYDSALFDKHFTLRLIFFRMEWLYLAMAHFLSYFGMTQQLLLLGSHRGCSALVVYSV